MTTTFDPLNPGPHGGHGPAAFAPGPATGPAADASALESAPATTAPADRVPGRGMPHHDLPVLEAYRGVAALMVVLTHVGFASGAAMRGPWAGWLSRLDFGVALFFLLSGFLLFRPYVQAAYGRRAPVRVGTYLRRRYVRLYPAFIVALAANYALTPDAREASTALWVKTFFLVQNYDVEFTAQLAGLHQLWSLCTEVSFYVALPLLAWMALGSGTWLRDVTPRPTAVERHARRQPTRRGFGRLEDWRPWRPAIALGLFALLALGWRVWAMQDQYAHAQEVLWLPGFMDWFGAGMALAWLRERPSGPPRQLLALAHSPGVSFSLALCTFWLVTTSLGGPVGLDPATAVEGLLKHVAYGVAATLLLIPAVFGSPGAGWRRWATTPVMRWLGQISFGVFLWHPFVMEAIRRGLDLEYFEGGFWLTLVLTLACTFTAATLSWHYIERPAQVRFRDGIRRRPAGEGDRQGGLPHLRLRR